MSRARTSQCYIDNGICGYGLDVNPPDVSEFAQDVVFPDNSSILLPKPEVKMLVAIDQLDPDGLESVMNRESVGDACNLFKHAPMHSFPDEDDTLLNRRKKERLLRLMISACGGNSQSLGVVCVTRRLEKTRGLAGMPSFCTLWDNLPEKDQMRVLDYGSLLKLFCTSLWRIYQQHLIHFTTTPMRTAKEMVDRLTEVYSVEKAENAFYYEFVIAGAILFNDEPVLYHFCENALWLWTFYPSIKMAMMWLNSNGFSDGSVLQGIRSSLELFAQKCGGIYNDLNDTVRTKDVRPSTILHVIPEAENSTTHDAHHLCIACWDNITYETNFEQCYHCQKKMHSSCADCFSYMSSDNSSLSLTENAGELVCPHCFNYNQYPKNL
jgi:hypothetical protein